MYQVIPNASLEEIAQMLMNIDCLSVVRLPSNNKDQVPPVVVAEDALVFCEWTV